MTVLGTDDFTAANGTSLTAHSSKWTMVNGAIEINNNRANSTQDSYDVCAAYYNDATFDDDQYSKGPFHHDDNDSENLSGYGVRYPSSGVSGYDFVGNSDNSYLRRINNSGSTTTLSSAGAIGDGNTIEIRAVGTTITAYINGSTTGAPAAQTDSTYSSGSAGIAFEQNGETAQLGDWEGGNVGGGPTITPKSTTYTATGAPSLTTVTTFQIQPNVTATGTSSLLKLISKFFGVSAIGSSTIQKTVGKVIDMTATGTAEQQEGLISQQSFNYTATGALSTATSLIISFGGTIKRISKAIVRNIVRNITRLMGE